MKALQSGLVLQHFLGDLDHKFSRMLSRHLITLSSCWCSLRSEERHTKDSDGESRSALRAVFRIKDEHFLCLLPVEFSSHYDMLLLL